MSTLGAAERSEGHMDVKTTMTGRAVSEDRWGQWRIKCGCVENLLEEVQREIGRRYSS